MCVGTAVTAADPATEPEQPQWMANNFDTYDEFDGLGVTFVGVVPVVTDQDDEADTPHEQEQHSSHKGPQAHKRPIDNRSNDNVDSANYSSHFFGKNQFNLAEKG